MQEVILLKSIIFYTAASTEFVDNRQISERGESHFQPCSGDAAAHYCANGGTCQWVEKLNTRLCR